MTIEGPGGAVENVAHGTERPGVNMRSSLWTLRLGSALASVHEVLGQQLQEHDSHARGFPTHGYLGFWPKFSVSLNLLLSGITGITGLGGDKSL